MNVLPRYAARHAKPTHELEYGKDTVTGKPLQSCDVICTHTHTRIMHAIGTVGARLPQTYRYVRAEFRNVGLQGKGGEEEVVQHGMSSFAKCHPIERNGSGAKQKNG